MKTAFSNTRTIPDLRNGEGRTDPRSAAIGGSCEDRGVAKATQRGRHTVTQAGLVGAP